MNNVFAYVFYGVLVAVFAFIASWIVIPVAILVAGMWLYRKLPVHNIPTDILEAQTKSPFPSRIEFEDRYPDDWKRLAGQLYSENDFSMPVQIGTSNISNAQYRDALKLNIKRNEQWRDIYATICNTIDDMIFDVDSSGVQSPFDTKLMYVLSNPIRIVLGMIAPLFRDDVDRFKLFPITRQQIAQNLERATGGKDVPLDEFQGTVDDLIRTYLSHTVLQYQFDKPVPFDIERYRVQHSVVTAASGHGKTQLLQHIIAHDTQNPDQPSLVIIDSQGDMLSKIERIDGLQDRLVIVDPTDAPALNLFAYNERIKKYDKFTREIVEADVVQLYTYIFSAISSDLTAKQGTGFLFIVKLVLLVPEATIHTLLKLIEDPSKEFSSSPFYMFADKLDKTAFSFFESQFYNKQAFGQTRQQIARRLYSVLSVPAFERMLSARENRLDLFEALQQGKIILINTNKALLKQEASALFGRFMIAQCLSAVFERIAVKPLERRRAYLIVDESQEYLDEMFQTLLEQARKYNCGALFAHQNIDQFSPAIRATIATNTAIKFAGGISSRDARALHDDMRTDERFLLSTRKTSKGAEFAVYVRDKTEHAVKITVPFGTLEKLPRMSDCDHQAMRERNRLALCATPQTEPITDEPTEPPPVAEPSKPEEKDDPLKPTDW